LYVVVVVVVLILFVRLLFYQEFKKKRILMYWKLHSSTGIADFFCRFRFFFLSQRSRDSLSALSNKLTEHWPSLHRRIHEWCYHHAFQDICKNTCTNIPDSDIQLSPTNQAFSWKTNDSDSFCLRCTSNQT